MMANDIKASPIYQSKKSKDKNIELQLEVTRKADYWRESSNKRFRNPLIALISGSGV